VPLLALLALAAFGDVPFGRESSSVTASSTQRPTAPPASGRLLDDRALHPTLGADVAATAPDSVQSLPAPASPEAAGSRPASTYHVPVLMYHRIAPPSERGHDLPDLVVDPKRFDAQLAALKAHGWRTITSAELAAAMEARVPIPTKTFVITVDDGHADGYTHAFPILTRYGFVATFFVITSRLDRPGWLTWAELGEMQAAGMEIGNHTVSHVSEAGYSRAQTNQQVMGAQAAISRHLGVTPISFAYPYGRMPANLIASVEASGIKVAYTTAGGLTETLGTAYFLPRLRISATTNVSGILWLVQRHG
jgi:peptidoglycan/xylan/chitin deacetylase (PgdA/CDA1 family)